MKKILACLLMLVMVTGLVSCQNRKQFLEDTYVEGQDQAYMYLDLVHATQEVAETEDGYYFLISNRLFFVDKTTLQMIPLCNKPDCLHEKETDTQKTWKCNAYFFSGYHGFISYWNGNLYIMVEYNQEGNKLPHGGLIKVSKDGTKRTLVFEPQEEASIFVLHRGVFYYSSETYDRGLNANYNIHAVDLQNGGKDEILYHGEKESGSIQDMLCYGNHLYFREDFSDEEGNLKTEIKEINLNSREITTLESEDDEKYILMQGVFQDQIYYTLNGPDVTEDWTWKRRNLDGSGEQDWFTTPVEQKLYADTEYFYLYTPWMFIMDTPDDPVLYMLDQEGNQLGSFDFGQIEGRQTNFIPGGEDYFFIVSEEDGASHYYAVNKKEMAETGKGTLKELFKLGDIVMGASDLPV